MTDRKFLEHLAAKHKRTFKSMQKLTMSIADYVSDKGKEENLLKNLASTLASMDMEGVISLEFKDNEIAENFFRVFSLFQGAYPNWQEVYLYIKTNEFKESLIATTQYLKKNGTSKALEHIPNPFVKPVIIFVCAIVLAYFLFERYGSNTEQLTEKEYIKCLDDASKRPTTEGVKLASSICYKKASNK